MATRKNPSIKGVPKSMNQIHSKKGNVSLNTFPFHLLIVTITHANQL